MLCRPGTNHAMRRSHNWIRRAAVASGRKRVGRFGTMVGIIAFGALGPVAVAADQATVLHAIHMVENPTNSTRVGRRGELGPYQFRPTTWRMYTTKSFQLATDQQESDIVADKHYAWIQEGLRKAGLEPTPYRIALVWNAGLTATVTGRITSHTRHYAKRVENLVAEVTRETQLRRQQEVLKEQQLLAARAAAEKQEAAYAAAAAAGEHPPIVFSLARASTSRAED
jgi:hypothetical protein